MGTAPSTTKATAKPATEGDQAEAKVDKKIQPLDRSRMREAEFMRRVWVMTAHENQVAADLEEPLYWSHVSGDMKPWDRLEVRANDGTWYAECLVLDAGRAWAKVKVLQEYRLTTADVSMSAAAKLSPFSVEFKGPHSQWCVIRKADKVIVHEGAGTEGAAIDWMNEYVKAMAR